MTKRLMELFDVLIIIWLFQIDHSPVPFHSRTVFILTDFGRFLD
ncbi:Hypothetical protein Eab7_1033 [Exiguobacterium antarcticum B7]|nr:Hypothetical protein Eab7_1033 [Exiguobacterium antarcticum B7]